MQRLKSVIESENFYKKKSLKIKKEFITIMQNKKQILTFIYYFQRKLNKKLKKK